MPLPTFKPYWQTTDKQFVRLFHGDVIDTLKRLPSKSVHCVITSPPYWGLRDYGTAQIDPTTGRADCEHDFGRGNQDHKSSVVHKEGYKSPFLGTATDGSSYLEQGSMSSMTCLKCGAKRIDSQIGSEPLPDCFGWTTGNLCDRCHVCKMVKVFREVHRVLRNDGTCWMNYGDSYSSGGSTIKPGGGVFEKGRTDGRPGDGGRQRWADGHTHEIQVDKPRGKYASDPRSLPSGNLVGVPWRVALALQADGWILRQDIIWHKPAPMPESVRNRCTKAHEYVFLLAKSAKYFYDAEAIKVDAEPSERVISGKSGSAGQAAGAGVKPSGNGVAGSVMRTGSKANKRSVWSISSEGYEGAHFATFPLKLIEPMIKAGTSEKGCCGSCGAPWKRVVSEGTGGAKGSSWGCHDDDDEKGNAKTASSRGDIPGKTTGWHPSCECHGKFVKKTVVTKRAKGQAPTAQPVGSDDHTAAGHNTDEGRAKVAKGRDTSAGNRNGKGASTLDAPKRITHDDLSEDVETSVIEYVPDIPFDEHPVVPCTVLDPFMGAATTSVVAIQNGRRSVGIELNEKYIKENQIPRVEGMLLDRPATSHLVPGKETKVIKIGRDV